MTTAAPLRLVPWWELPQPTDVSWALAAGRVARAAAVGASDVLFAALAEVCAQVAGWRLFTVLVVDHDHGLARRVHTSDPAVYPMGGGKPFAGSELGDTAFVDGRAFIAETPAELERVFPDHETIVALGCGAALNVPVRHRGEVIGSVNLLDEPMAYRTDAAAAVGPLAQFTAATLIGLSGRNR